MSKKDHSKKKAEEFEGRDIMYYIDHPEELMKFLDGVIDDELTKGRIRTIYAQLKYGEKTVQDVADYYNLPVYLIRDIKDRKIFGEITDPSSFRMRKGDMTSE